MFPDIPPVLSYFLHSKNETEQSLFEEISTFRVWNNSLLAKKIDNFFRENPHINNVAGRYAIDWYTVLHLLVLDDEPFDATPQFRWIAIHGIKYEDVVQEVDGSNEIILAMAYLKKIDPNYNFVLRRIELKVTRCVQFFLAVNRDPEICARKFIRLLEELEEEMCDETSNGESSEGKRKIFTAIIMKLLSAGSSEFISAYLNMKDFRSLTAFIRPFMALVERSPAINLSDIVKPELGMLAKLFLAKKNAFVVQQADKVKMQKCLSTEIDIELRERITYASDKDNFVQDIEYLNELVEIFFEIFGHELERNNALITVFRCINDFPAKKKCLGLFELQSIMTYVFLTLPIDTRFTLVETEFNLEFALVNVGTDFLKSDFDNYVLMLIDMIFRSENLMVSDDFISDELVPFIANRLAQYRNSYKTEISGATGENADKINGEYHYLVKQGPGKSIISHVSLSNYDLLVGDPANHIARFVCYDEPFNLASGAKMVFLRQDKQWVEQPDIRIRTGTDNELQSISTDVNNAIRSNATKGLIKLFKHVILNSPGFKRGWRKTRLLIRPILKLRSELSRFRFQGVPQINFDGMQELIAELGYEDSFRALPDKSGFYVSSLDRFPPSKIRRERAIEKVSNEILLRNNQIVISGPILPMRFILGMIDLSLLEAAMEVLFFRKIDVIKSMSIVPNLPSGLSNVTGDSMYRTFYFTDSELRQASIPAVNYLNTFFAPPGHVLHNAKNYSKILLVYSVQEMTHVYSILNS
jgi:hypothetical protein